MFLQVCTSFFRVKYAVWNWLFIRPEIYVGVHMRVNGCLFLCVGLVMLWRHVHALPHLPLQLHWDPQWKRAADNVCNTHILPFFFLSFWWRIEGYSNMSTCAMEIGRLRINWFHFKSFEVKSAMSQTPSPKRLLCCPQPSLFTIRLNCDHSFNKAQTKWKKHFLQPGRD